MGESSQTPEEPITLRRAGAEAFDEIEQARVLATVRSRMFDETAAIRLSRYVLVEKIGEGGMGVVYRAFDPSLERQVAVKAVHTTRRDADSTARFMREAKALARFTHPNVVAVHDVGTFDLSDYHGIDELNPHGHTDGEGAFIVMELVDGEDLSAWLESGTRSVSQILDVFAAAGQGLAALHDAGLAHRDFKLSNVLVARDGRVCVADFGLAGAVDLPSTDPSLPPHVSEEITETNEWTRLTQTGAAIGTPAYMSPEQHRGEPADARSDQYAFCVALYRALVGNAPFSGSSSRALLRAKTEQYPPPVRDALRIPQRVTKAMFRGLHPEPGRRFPNVRALLAALGVRPGRTRRRILRALAWPTAAALGIAAAVPLLQPGTLQLEVLDGDQPITEFVLTVDGEATLPGALELSRGRHFVEVTAPGFRPAARAVEISAGSTTMLTINVDPIVGGVDVDVEPHGAILEVDGRDYGSLSDATLRIGAHEIVARAPGYWRDWFTVEVSAETPTKQQVSLIPAVRWSVPASGILANLAWVGDLDGDGRSEVGHQVFHTYTLYDPWRATELYEWELEDFEPVNIQDFDGDGKTDLALITEGRNLEVWNADTSQGPPVRRWQKPEIDANASVTTAEVALGRWAVVLAEPEARAIRAFDGVTGRVLWTRTLETAPHFVDGLGSAAPGKVVALSDDAVVLLDAGSGKTVWSVEHGTSLKGRGKGRHRRFAQVTDSHHPDWRTLIVDVPNVDGGRTLALDLVDGREIWARARGGARITPDVDGDGQGDVALAELLFSGRTGARIHRFRGQFALDGRRAVSLAGEMADVTALPSGEVLAHRRLPAGLRLVGVDDLDGDRRTEILVASTDGRLLVMDWDLDVFAIADLDARTTKALQAQDANGDGAPDLLLEADGPLLLSGTKLRWKRQALAPLRAGGALADFDGDGNVELVASGPERDGGKLRLLDPATGRAMWSVARPGGKDMIRPPVPLCVDGGCDVLVTTPPGVWRVSGRDGSEVAQYRAGEVYAPPLVADLDGDGAQEVIVVTWEKQRTLWVLDEQLRPKQKVELPQGSYAAPLLDDVDEDGRADAVLSLIGGYAAAVSLREPTEVLWTVELGGWAMHTPAKLPRGTGSADYVFTTRNKEIVVVSGSGEIVARREGVAWGSASATVLDVDGDEQPEVFVAGPGGAIRRMTPELEDQWTTVFSPSSRREELLPLGPLQVHDLDGDGKLELVAGWEDGLVMVVSAAHGELRWSFRAGDKIEAPTVIGDADADGIAELFVSSHDRGLYALGARPTTLRTGRTGGKL